MEDMEKKRDNHELVGRVMNRTLRDITAAFVYRELFRFYRADWWKLGVLNTVQSNVKRTLPREYNSDNFREQADMQFCLQLMWSNWGKVFRQKLSDVHQAWMRELQQVRNDWAHTDFEKFDDSYVERALDTMARFCEKIDDDTALELRSRLRKFRMQRFSNFDEEDDDDGEMFLSRQSGEFPSWREIMQPNPDVQDGAFKKAEFAADLAQVARGTSKVLEYQDATEFFSRTYMTVGMKRLMLEAINRLTSGNGEPMIEVKTSFGGGKTHSMMALYHLFNRKYRLDEIDKSVLELLKEAKLEKLPDDIHIAVAVGTDLNTERAKDIPELEGVQIHTLLGEICSQLARSAKRFDLYRKYIQLNDEREKSPGTSDLREFLDGCGGCLILLDELVAYGKKLYPGRNIEGGTFDAFITFLHELSEAVRTSDRSILIASLPQSEIEIGIGDGGRYVLDTIEHHFGRLQAVWSPVEVQESFEIVRRRLFMPCRREKARDEICAEFFAMYKRGAQTFPRETREKNYLERLKSCYPIHPQLFDLLYGKWATIEKFQKTRGVLRFMAEVIHRLWAACDNCSIILPSSIALGEPEVRNELTRYLPSNWSNIIDAEIDGVNSEPYKIDRATPSHFQYQTARRLTRTIFMGSAPTARGQNVRGLETKEIMLGILQPHERKETDRFRDMLETLKNKLTYLYSNETHSWFDGRPTLRKVAEALEQLIPDDDVDDDIIARLKSMSYRTHFNDRYVTSTPEDVPDEPRVRLVILPPSVPYCFPTGEKPPMYDAAEKILSRQREGIPRMHKNMLLFLAGDRTGIFTLRKSIKSLLAWKRMEREKEERNFDQAQLNEIEANIDQLEEQLISHISIVYSKMMEPQVDGSDMKKILWNDYPLKCVKMNNVEAMGRELLEQEAVLKVLNPEQLERELEAYLFKESDFVTIKELWEYSTQYIYAMRLYDQRVLFDAIRRAVREGVIGLADDYDEATGRYANLIFGDKITIEAVDQLIVRAEAAKRQLEIVEPEPVDDTTSEEPIEIEEAEEPPPRSVEMIFDLSVEQSSREIERCALTRFPARRFRSSA